MMLEGQAEKNFWGPKSCFLQKARGSSEQEAPARQSNNSHGKAPNTTFGSKSVFPVREFFLGFGALKSACRWQKVPRNKKALVWPRKVFLCFPSPRPKGEKAKPQQNKPGAQHVVFQARSTKKVRCQNKTFGARKVVFQTRAFLFKLANALCVEHCKKFAQATQRSNSSCLSLKKLCTERTPFLIARKNPFQQSDPIFTPKSITRTKSNFYQTI